MIFSFRDDLSPKVKSSLCEQEIHFPAYDADDLQKILTQRATVAFYDDVLDDAVIPSVQHTVRKMPETPDSQSICS